MSTSKKPLNTKKPLNNKKHLNTKKITLTKRGQYVLAIVQCVLVGAALGASFWITYLIGK